MEGRQTLFVSVSGLQGKRPQPRRSVLGSSLGEDVFFRSASKLDARWEHFQQAPRK